MGVFKPYPNHLNSVDAGPRVSELGPALHATSEISRGFLTYCFEKIGIFSQVILPISHRNPQENISAMCENFSINTNFSQFLGQILSKHSSRFLCDNIQGNLEKSYRFSR